MVLSTTSGMPASCAMSAIAARSQTTPSGFEALSTKIALVRLRSARLNSAGLVGSTKRAPPAEFRKGLAELGDRAAIEPGRGDQLVAGLHQVEQRDELGGMAARHGAGRGAALECCDALLEHRDRGVGDARVDVAEALQVEQRGGMVDVVEHEGGGLVDRRGARTGGRIGRGAGVDRQGLETVLLAHLPLLARPRDPRRATLVLPTGGEGSGKRWGSQTAGRRPAPAQFPRSHRRSVRASLALPSRGAPCGCSTALQAEAAQELPEAAPAPLPGPVRG